MNKELYKILLEAGYIVEGDSPIFPGKNYLDSVAGCDIYLYADDGGYYVVVDVNQFTNDEAEKCEQALLNAGFVKEDGYISEMGALCGDDEEQIAGFLGNSVSGIMNLLAEFDE